MKKAYVILLFPCLVLLSCPMGCRPLAHGKGSLVIGLSDAGPNEKTILPSLDTAIASCDVHGTGPSSAAFSQTGVTGSTVLQSYLTPGSWTITVNAFNASHEEIGAGAAVVTIDAGKTVGASVQVLPLAGTGTLTVALAWPSGAVTDPGVSGTLTPAGGTGQVISFTIGTDSASFSSGTLEAGYYSLVVQLSDGTTLEWGGFEAVQILKGLTTTAGFNLGPQDLLSGE
jgi:hypothetical protein